MLNYGPEIRSRQCVLTLKIRRSMLHIYQWKISWCYVVKACPYMKERMFDVLLAIPLGDLLAS